MTKRQLIASMTVAALSSCRGSHDSSPAKEVSIAHHSSAKNDLSAQIQRSEQAASVERTCERPIEVFDGSITVSSSDHMHPVAHGKDVVDEPIADLDKTLSKSTRVRFTLTYPFERPFAGVVTGEITLRRTIDAVRAGFRQMYEGTSQRDIPGLENKDVAGPYGRAFHVIGDLVIERIDLCADDTFSVAIGS